MNNGWLLTSIVSAFLLPPLNLLVVGTAGFLLRKRWPRFGPFLCVLSVLMLVVLCTGAGARLLGAPLERLSAPLVAPRAAGAQAIVVLGGGRIRNAPEYGGKDVPGTASLMRLRYGAALQRETGLPILVTGGLPDGSGEPEAVVMARVLTEEFNAPVRWVERASNNTAENARLSAAMLGEAGVRRVLLVTDAFHMERARQIFVRAGLDVIPAPTQFRTREPLEPIDFVPNGHDLGMSHYALHEWIGMLWYRLRY